MTVENSEMRDHIRQTLETIKRLDKSADLMLHRQLSQMVDDQYAALIDLSVAELRVIASDSAAPILASSPRAARKTSS
jgi:hypothetical protein